MRLAIAIVCAGFWGLALTGRPGAAVLFFALGMAVLAMTAPQDL